MAGLAIHFCMSPFQLKPCFPVLKPLRAITLWLPRRCPGSGINLPPRRSVAGGAIDSQVRAMRVLGSQ